MGAWEPIRIGYELMDTVEAQLVDELMARAVGYWAQTLQVRRAQAPLLMESKGSGCFRYAFDSEFRCTSLAPPVCGKEVPAKYLKAQRACQETCAPRLVSDFEVVPVDFDGIFGEHPCKTPRCRPIPALGAASRATAAPAMWTSGKGTAQADDFMDHLLSTA